MHHWLWIIIIRRPSGVLDPEFPTSLDFLVFLVSKILREAPSPQKLGELTKSQWFFRIFGVPGHPWGASGPPYLAIFPIFFAISANFPQKNSPKLLSMQKYRDFFDFPCSWTPKIIENHWKTIVFSMILLISHISHFQPVGTNSGQFLNDFEWICPLKWLWRH